MTEKTLNITLRVKDDGSIVVEKFAGNAEKGAERASAAWKNFGYAAAAAIATASVTAALFLKKSIDLADATGKAAAKLGMTTEALSGLAYTASLADVSSEELNQSLLLMNRNLSDAAKGGGTAKDAIKELGLNAAALAQMQPDQAVAAIADALEQVPNAGDRARLSMDIFGRSGANMINVLRGGSAALREGHQEAERFGKIISEETARKAEQFKDNLSRLNAAGSGMANTMAAQMLPAMVGISDAMVDTAKNSGVLDAAGKALGVTLQGLFSVGLLVGNVFQQTGTWIGAAAAAAIAAAKGNFSEARAIFAMAAEDIERINEDSAASIAKVWQGATHYTAEQLAELKLGEENLAAARRGGTITPTSATDEARAAIEEYKKELQHLMDTLFPVEAEMREFDKSLAMLSKEFSAGRMGNERYNESVLAMVFGLSEVKAANEAATKTAQAANEAATKTAQAETEAANKRIQALFALKEAQKAHLDASREWRDGVTRFFRDYADSATNSARLVENALTRAMQAGEDAFIRLATTGKESMSDLFTSIAEEVLRYYYRTQISGPMAQIFGSLAGGLFGSLAGGLFGGGVAARTFTGADGLTQNYPAQHSGGIAGAEASSMRAVSMDVFRSAPRLHSGGLAGDEVPTILRKGEGVFTPGQMRALSPASGGGAQNVRVEIINQGQPQEVVSARPSFDVDGMVIQIVTRDVRVNGPITRALSGSFNLNRSGG